MPTTQAVTQRHRQVEHMILWAKAHCDEVTAGIERMVEPILSWMGAPSLNAGNLQRFWISILDYYFRRLDAAEEAYQFKKSNAYPMRNRRDELTRTLYEKVVALRGILERQYCREASEAVTGYRGKTPRDPYELALTSIFLLSRLRRADLSKVRSSLSSLDVDLPKIA